jgi:hypothetical protein
MERGLCIFIDLINPSLYLAKVLQAEVTLSGPASFSYILPVPRSILKFVLCFLRFSVLADFAKFLSVQTT